MKTTTKRRRRTMKVTWHEPSGQFRKCIGLALGRSGAPVAKVHYLGPDEDEAIRKAVELSRQWKDHKAAGGKLWDELKTTATANPGALTVKTSADQYLVEIKRKVDAGQNSQSHYLSQKFRLNRAIKPIENLPLSMVDEAKISDAVFTLAKRPEYETPSGKTKTTSETYVKASIASLKFFLSWADETELWTKPRRFDRLFQVTLHRTHDEKMKNLPEYGSNEPVRFTLDDLTKLFAATADNDRYRLWFLLALNCGFDGEIGDLHDYEIFALDTATPYIARYRRKARRRSNPKGVYAKWPLWKETADLLRKFLVSGRSDHLALLTENDLPIVTTGKHDALNKSWNAYVLPRSGVTKRADLGRISFGVLRKTAGDFLRRQHGDELADMFLSHRDPRKMLSAYAGRDWDEKLAPAVVAFRQYLEPMFTAKPSTVTTTTTLLAPQGGSTATA